MASDDLIVGLDIGTTKICAIIGQIDENGSLEIIGVGLGNGQYIRYIDVVYEVPTAVKSPKKVGDFVGRGSTGNSSRYHRHSMGHLTAEYG